jgi:hypothetical protein
MAAAATTHLKSVLFIGHGGTIEISPINMLDIEYLLASDTIRHSILLACGHKYSQLKIGFYYNDQNTAPYNKLASELMSFLYNKNGKRIKTKIYGDIILHHLDRDLTADDWELIKSIIDDIKLKHTSPNNMAAQAAEPQNGN